MFKESEKIVCINASGFLPDAARFSSLPVYHQVYTVRGVINQHNVWGVYLVGITGQICLDTNNEWAFSALCFRELSEVKAENARQRLQSKPPEISTETEGYKDSYPDFDFGHGDEV